MSPGIVGSRLSRPLVCNQYESAFPFDRNPNSGSIFPMLFLLLFFSLSILFLSLFGCGVLQDLVLRYVQSAYKYFLNPSKICKNARVG